MNRGAIDQERGANELIAKILGDQNLATRVAEMIAGIRERSLMFHGIRHRDHFHSVGQIGVLANSPNSRGAYSSYWTTGINVFHNGLPGMMGTYNTSFFHYAHIRPDGIYGMQLASTSKDLLNKEGISTNPDDIKTATEITVDQAVPQSLLEIIRVTFSNEPPTGQAQSREIASKLEYRLFEECERLSKEGIRPGIIKDIKIP